jgi:histidine triad (HIT) family protein
MPGHLSLPVTDRCAFCDYLSGARKYTILHADELAAVLVTREQRGAAHVLVLPIRHTPSVLELFSAESYRVMDLIRASASAIDEIERRPGISVWQNNGTSAGQAIPHLHFHVAGTNEGGGTEWDDVPELSILETEKIAVRLRPAFKAALS